MKTATAAPRTTTTTTTTTVSTVSRLVTTSFLMLSTLLRPAQSFVAQQSFHCSRTVPRPNRRGSTSALSFVTTTLRGGAAATGASYSTTSSLAMADSNSKPFAVVVTAEIQADRMDEFLEMIQFNAENSRKEPGCIRFDVLRSQGNPNQFTFYELYKNMAAVDFHKTQPHYEKWAAFKESGGTVSSVSVKSDGEFVEM